MRSAEIADLAGVSVRTIRHYHQIGVLPEPARESNGYRTYDLAALVRVLRLKSLTAAGLSLTAAAEITDGEEGSGLSAALEGAEKALTQQIDQLRRQRDIIATARALGTAPDLPPELLRSASQIAGHAPAEMVDALRAEAALSAAILGVDRTSELQRLLLDAPEAPAILQATARFVHLTPEADDVQIADVVESLRTSIATLPSSYVQVFGDTEHQSAADTLVELYRSSGLNPAQTRVLELLDTPA